MPRLPLAALSRTVQFAGLLLGLVLLLSVFVLTTRSHARAGDLRAASGPTTKSAAARPAPPAATPHKARAHVRKHGHRRAHHASRSHRRHGWVRPVRGRVTSGFGPRWGSFHPGVDIGARYGRKVHAITSGRVVSAGWIPGYGKTVRVRRDGRTFFYPHLSRIHVRHGWVRTGQMIGRVGSTGYSTGPHLHIEIRKHGRPVNPRPILRRHGVRL